MEPGFFDYFNSFMYWDESNSLTDKAGMLYIRLLHTFNRRGWEEWTGINTPQLMILANTTREVTARRARDELVQAGLIEYKPGKKGKPSEYRLLCKGKRSKAGTASPPPQPEPKPQPEKATAKPKPKQEPPPAPSDAPPRHDVQQQRFDVFWQEYPRKVGKKAALTVWKKLKPNNELFERILYAVRQAKQSDQWQKDNGQFIPHPTTWLNQGRWDDELQPSPAASVNNTKGDKTNGNHREGNSPNGSESAEKRDKYGLPVL